MDISTYETLTGRQVATSQESYYEAIIAKAKSMLENMLGYTLDAQSGATTRYFQYNKNDRYITLDPFETLTSVELVRDAEVIFTFTTDDYRLHTSNGITKSIEPYNLCIQSSYCMGHSQLKVEGEWEWDDLPVDLQMLWADMVSHYADPAYNIKSQTLATHSYTKSDMKAPQDKRENQIVIGKYQGGNGQGIIIPTL